MTVYSKTIRHLNARWFVDSASNNRIYCGLSKSAILLSENQPNVQDALNNCNLFSKVKASFVEKSTEDDYDVKLLTEQIYKQNNIVKNHTFKDNDCYWKYIPQQQALLNSCYNVESNFVLSNIDNTKYDFFKNIKTFYFFYNLKINNMEPVDDQLIRSESDEFNADYIIVLERLTTNINGDSGCCSICSNDLNIPDTFTGTIHYFISF